MAFRDLIIPIKYKFLAVLLLILLSALGVFFFFTQQIFSEDKRLFVMDLNLTLLRAATSDIKLELKTRLEELQILVPRLYKSGADASHATPFDGLSPTLSEEVLRVTIYRKVDADRFEVIRDFRNNDLLEKRHLVQDTFAQIDKRHPLALKKAFVYPTLEVLNRSVRVVAEQNTRDLGIITFLLPGTFVDSNSQNILIVADLVQDFLRRKLQQSDVAQLFLISADGQLLSHAVLSQTVEYAGQKYPHPILARLKSHHFPRESFEVQIDDEPYLCNLSQTGFNDVFAVSQIKKSEAFAALRLMREKSVLLAALIFAVAIIASILFAARLTANIQKLKFAAEQIGAGNWSALADISSNDEVQSVSDSFNWMAKRLKELVKETAQKARMEDELETARLVQSTLLTSPEIKTSNIELVAHYSPATECGGDVWDAHLEGNTLTVFIADATGHGAPAAIVTAVAKSCFNTLNTVYIGQPLSPEQFATSLNQVIHSACHGQLLMTMCIVQVNLETGELKVCNAGHESPLLLRGNRVISRSEKADKKQKAEVLFARGERLGFDPAAEYESVIYQLTSGDTILLYTDGISEAHDSAGKEWGERALKKIFALQGPRPLTVIKQQLVDAVTDHTRGAPQEDDVTFVLMTLKQAGSASQRTPPGRPGDRTQTGVGELTGSIKRGQIELTHGEALKKPAVEKQWEPTKLNDDSGNDDSGNEAA